MVYYYYTDGSYTIPPMSTRGHSSIKKWSYSPKYLDDTYVPEFVYPRHRIDTTGEENDIRRSVNKELMFSSHAVEDTYDMASKSRNRDQEILRSASQAIPPSKTANTLPSASLKASAPPSPLRRFPPMSSSRRPQPQDGSQSRGGSAYRTTSSFVPLGSLSRLDWSSPSSRALYKSRNRDLDSYEYRKPILLPESTASEYSTPSTSPYQSPRSSPDRELGYTARRRRPKVLGSKFRVGNYYTKLLQKRANKPPEREPKYWPYYDVDSIASDDSEEEYSTRYSSLPPEDEEYGARGGGDYYIVQRDRSPSPAEYVPFTPRRTTRYDDDDDDEGDNRSVIPKLQNLSVSRDVSRVPETSKSSVAEDVLFYNVVAETAAKARKALQSVDLNDYENASLVLSVEGEYKDPKEGQTLGFQYISRPLPLKGPMLATGPGSYAATMGTDSAFEKYFKDMRIFREQIRNRLESGYQALRDASNSYRSKYYDYKSLPSHETSVQSYEKPYTPVSYRNRLDDGSEDRLVVYPLSKRASSLAPTSDDDFPEHTKKVELYESAANLKLSTLDKIKIKVDTETYHSPKAAVASRRARSQPPSSVTVTARTTLSNRSSVPPRATVVSAPSYTSNRGSHKEAALVGSKVDVVVPKRKRPRSKYAQAVVREMNLKKHEESQGSEIPQSSTGHLHASPRPVRSVGGGKRYLDEEGKVTKPKNIMSWKYRLQSRVAPEDLLYQPKIYANVRDQLRDVHDKMDRHRQLMDRYLITDPSTEDVKSKIMSMYCDMEDRYPHRYRGRSGAATKSSAEVSHSTAGTSVRQKTPAPYSPSRVLLQSETQDNYRPISDVRRRVRRVICKNRKDPSYFK